MFKTRLVAQFILCCTALAFSQAWAGDRWPEHPVRLVVPASAGGSMDMMVRALATKMSQESGATFIVENRPGGAGLIAREYVAKAPNDGTILLLGSAHELTRSAFTPGLSRPLAGGDFVPVVKIASMPNLVVVNSKSKIRSLNELVQAARTSKRKGGLDYGIGSIGNVQHLIGISFAHRIGAEMTAIPYKGSAPALTSLIGGQIEVLFDTMPAASAYVRSGQLRALAVTSAKRSPIFPDVPTLKESGFKDMVVETWYGVFAPAGTPDSVVRAISKMVNTALQDKQLVKLWASWGSAHIEPQTPAQFSSFVRAEAARWKKEITQAGIKAGGGK